MSGETILLGGILIGLIGLVLFAHWVDRRNRPKDRIV